MIAAQHLSNTTPYDLFVARLQGVRPAGDRRCIARCPVPAHDDHKPSLNVRAAESGAVLLYCYSGCTAADIVAAVGLELSDLFPRPETERDDPKKKPFVQRLWKSPLTPLVARFEKDLILVHVFLRWVADGKPISETDQAAAGAAAGRIWHALGEARHVL